METLTKDSFLPLYLLIIFFIGLFTWYYFYQKRNPRLGGRISIPKAYWLGFAMFVYFVLPLWAYYALEAPKEIKLILVVMIVLAYCRMVVQGILMYIFKNWIPLHGIAFNVIFILSMIFVIAYTAFYHPAFLLDYISLILVGILFILIATLDSYYGARFFKEVGNATTGNAPIWYVYDQKVFSSLNRITWIGNITLTIFLIIILYLMKVHYGQF